MNKPRIKKQFGVWRCGETIEQFVSLTLDRSLWYGPVGVGMTPLEAYEDYIKQQDFSETLSYIY